jgi:hypothetical protein
MADDKKIIVDDDWKEQAQKEKEQLKEQEKEQELKAQEQDLEKQETASEEAEPKAGERPPLPEANFPGLISMLATQVFFALGLISTDQNKGAEPDLEMAKFNIDMLGVLEEKSKGNLSDDESKMLNDTLQQLRMAFVQVSQKE